MYSRKHSYPMYSHMKWGVHHKITSQITPAISSSLSGSVSNIDTRPSIISQKIMIKISLIHNNTPSHYFSRFHC